MNIEKVADQIIDKLFPADSGGVLPGPGKIVVAITDVLSEQTDLLKVLGENKWDLEYYPDDTLWMVHRNIDLELLGLGETPAEAILNAIE